MTSSSASLASRSDLPSGARRVWLALGVGLAAAMGTWFARAAVVASHPADPRNVSDFAQVWYAARALLDGIDPYSVVGPDKAFHWDFPLLYPLPAVLAAVPFSLMPLPVAEATFVGIGCALFAYAVAGRTNPTPLWALASLGMVRLATTVQWSPLVTAGALIPSAGFLLACKPTLGAALLIAYPSRKAVVGAALFTGLSILVWPSWVASWLAALPTATHMTPAVLRDGGWVMLLAALRWRHADGRLLLAMSFVPHSPLPYEVFPLFLLAMCFEEAVLLILMTGAWHYAIAALAPFDGYQGWMLWNGRCELWLMYFPSLGIVLRRFYVERVRIRSRAELRVSS